MSRPTRNVIVSVVDLRRRLGERREVSFDVLLAPLAVVDTRSDPEEPVRGTVMVESIERGVSIRGEATFSWVGSCRRCLDDVAGATVVDLDEIFQVDAPEDSDLVDFDGERIDLLPVIRDAVLGALPLAPLCRRDCAGPDPERYPALSADQYEAEQQEQRRQAREAAVDDPVADPRWSALAELDLAPEVPDQ